MCRTARLEVRRWRSCWLCVKLSHALLLCVAEFCFGCSIPAGLDKTGLPVGLELDGPAWSDSHLLAVGCAVEEILAPTMGHLPMQKL